MGNSPNGKGTLLSEIKTEDVEILVQKCVDNAVKLHVPKNVKEIGTSLQGKEMLEILKAMQREIKDLKQEIKEIKSVISGSGQKGVQSISNNSEKPTLEIIPNIINPNIISPNIISPNIISPNIISPNVIYNYQKFINFFCLEGDQLVAEALRGLAKSFQDTTSKIIQVKSTVDWYPRQGDLNFLFVLVSNARSSKEILLPTVNKQTEKGGFHVIYLQDSALTARLDVFKASAALSEIVVKVNCGTRKIDLVINAEDLSSQGYVEYMAETLLKEQEALRNHLSSRINS